MIRLKRHSSGALPPQQAQECSPWLDTPECKSATCVIAWRPAPTAAAMLLRLMLTLADVQVVETRSNGCGLNDKQRPN